VQRLMVCRSASELRAWIAARGTALGASDAVVLIAKTMELVESVAGLRGPEKHRFALNVLSIAAQEGDVDPELIRACITLADSTMPVLVQWAKGNTAVNRAFRAARRCCTLL